MELQELSPSISTVIYLCHGSMTSCRVLVEEPSDVIRFQRLGFLEGVINRESPGMACFSAEDSGTMEELGRT